MLRDLRGYNLIFGLWKTVRRERGLWGPPNDFYAVRGDASTEMDYEQYCAALKAAGVNWLAVKLTGWNNALGSRSAAFEPPPHGTFNLWNIALNPANIAQYRANQHAPPFQASAWAGSNVGQFVTAAARHGIKFYVILFDNREFRDGWRRHAWNSNNYYIDGTQCAPADRGFMANVRNVFTNPAALDAARRRIDAAMAMFEGHESVIGAWSIMVEQTWLATPDWLGTDGWNDEFVSGIHEMRDWNDLIARYIKARSPVPVGISHAYENAVKTGSVRAELYDAPSLDWVGINAYSMSADKAHDWLRIAQARYPGKQMVVSEYHPGGTDASPPAAAPYRLSKGVEWSIVCGNPGMVGPLRWPDTRDGTYATPELRGIAGVSSRMARVADLGSWGAGRSWDARVSSPDLALASTWGDGRHLTAFLRWSADGQKPVTVGGLANGDYDVRWFDWLAGDEVHQQSVTVDDGKLSLDKAVSRGRHAALLVIPADGIRPSPSESESASESASDSASESASPSPSVEPPPTAALQLVITDDQGAVTTFDLAEGQTYTVQVTDAQ
jgi:hypothetical protein